MQEIQTLFIQDKTTRITYFFKGYTSGQVTKTNTVTTYTTVEGTPMSDYSYKELNKINLSLIVSDINQSGRYTYYVDNVYRTGGIDDLKELLDSWRTDCTLLTIQTRTEQFDNMYINSVTYSENDDNRGVFNPSISLQEQRRAYINTVQMGPFATPESRAQQVKETSTGVDSGTSTASLVGEGAGTIGSSVLLGASIGAAVGHPLIGAGIGLVAGAIKFAGDKFGWWN